MDAVDMEMNNMEHIDRVENIEEENSAEFEEEIPLLPTQPISDTEHVEHENEERNNGSISPMKRKSSIGHNENEAKKSDEPPQSPTKRVKHEDSFKVYKHDLKIGEANAPFTLKPLNDDNIVNENSKVIMSSLFLPYQKEITLDEILSNEITIDGEEGNVDNKKSIIDKDEINIDIPIDDNGQTALHLAATLGKIKLVEELINKKANRFRGDNEGQTALIRVVHTTNCFELLCFSELLDLLYPTIKLIDNRGRTILHHIALTCGLKGRYDSSKYYLESLLEWVVKKGSEIGLTLTNFIKEVVNKSDKYGNTCLNYATLAGNKYIVSQLLDIGADPYKANKIGVTPGDYGIDVDSTVSKNGFLTTFKDKEEDKKESNDENEKDKVKENVNVVKFKEKFNSFEILDSMQKFISDIGKEFREEMNEKYEQIERLNPILKEKTLELSRKRKQYDELQKMIGQITKMSNKIDNLNKAIEEEEQEFQSEIKNLSIDINQENCLGDFDADQPFTISPLYEDIEKIVEKMLQSKKEDISDNENNEVDEIALLEKISVEDVLREYTNVNIDTSQLPPSVVLEARVLAYKSNNESLMSRVKQRQAAHGQLETQFRRIVGLCIGTDPEEIDNRLLSSLLLSVENDPDPELGQIRKVLQIVGGLNNENTDKNDAVAASTEA